MTPYVVDLKGSSRKPYLLLKDINYHSRYGRSVFIPSGRRSDGATGAYDIISDGWWIHDELCDTGLFKDGSRCNNLQASTILYDILRKEGYWFRARSWFITTLVFGGGKTRDNGIFK